MIIRTVCTDVVVLAIASYIFCANDEFWIEFGTRSNLYYLVAHQYASALGPDKTRALLAITGCDTLCHSLLDMGKR